MSPSKEWKYVVKNNEFTLFEILDFFVFLYNFLTKSIKKYLAITSLRIYKQLIPKNGSNIYVENRKEHFLFKKSY